MEPDIFAVIIPSYNEDVNIVKVISSIRILHKSCMIVVVDDYEPMQST
jgi:glycosyltransferase involved in cell wall biosynthesis